MPALGPATAALSDAELRETLDLHSGVLAKMSDKLDEQGALQQQTDRRFDQRDGCNTQC
jgi:hypothetical protein